MTDGEWDAHDYHKQRRGCPLTIAIITLLVAALTALLRAGRQHPNRRKTHRGH